MSRVPIQKVSSTQLQKIIRQDTQRGSFLAREGRKWVALDNSTGDRWVEEFTQKCQAVRWLRGKFEVGDRTKVWTGINYCTLLTKH